MKSLVESMARKIPGYDDNPDIRVANEVIVRSVINALLRGMSAKYSLVVNRDSNGTRYSYHLDVPGTVVDVSAMREACAMITLEGSVSTLEGIECLCRYLFTIYAFMPEYVVGFTRHLGQSSADISKLKNALSCVSEFVIRVLDLRGSGCSAQRVEWGAVYKMCLKKLLPPLLSMHAKELASVAYCVYASAAAAEITKRRDDLKQFLMSEGVVATGGAAALHQKLTFLSNLNPSIASHFKVRESIDPRRRSTTLMVRGHSRIIQSISDNREWAYVVNDRVNETIRDHAHVNAEWLLLVSMLFGKAIGITESNVCALILNNGGVAYTFKREFSFPMLEERKLHDGLGGGILSTEEGKELVDLLLESHRTRQSCMFGISYKRLAQEVRKLSGYFNMSSMGIDGSVAGVFSHVVRYVHDALLGQNAFDKEVLQHAKDLASFLAERVSFLREFVDSQDYPLLADFLEQSNAMDTHKDFERYLRSRRACDEEKAKEEAQKQDRRRTLKLVRATGELIGFLLMASGMISVCSAIYARNNAITELGSLGLGITMGVSDLLVLGFVIFSIGFVVTTASWVSAKGASSAFKELKSVCTLNKDGVSSALSTDVEYHLQIPEGVDLNSIGFVGICNMDDFKALVDECKASLNERRTGGSHRGREKKKAPFVQSIDGGGLKKLTDGKKKESADTSLACVISTGGGMSDLDLSNNGEHHKRTHGGRW